MNEKKLYKSKANKKVSGVCAGIANYFALDPTLIRLIWGVAIAFAGAGVLAYIICAIVIPDPPEGYAEYIPNEETLKGLHKSKDDRKIFGVCGGLGEYFRIDPTIIRIIWAVAAVCAGFGLLAYIVAAIIMNE